MAQPGLIEQRTYLIHPPLTVASRRLRGWRHVVDMLFGGYRWARRAVGGIWQLHHMVEGRDQWIPVLQVDDRPYFTCGEPVEIECYIAIEPRGRSAYR